MPKLGRPLPFNLVKVRSAEEVRQIRARSRRNLRSYTAMFVFFFTGIFLANLILILADFRGLSFSHDAIPVWMAMAVATPLFIIADVLTVMSIVGNVVESIKNRRCLWAFLLTIIGYAILIPIVELT